MPLFQSSEVIWQDYKIKILFFHIVEIYFSYLLMYFFVDLRLVLVGFNSLFQPFKFSPKMTSLNLTAHFLPILKKFILVTLLKFDITLIWEIFNKKMKKITKVENWMINNLTTIQFLTKITKKEQINFFCNGTFFRNGGGSCYQLLEINAKITIIKCSLQAFQTLLYQT